jgi:hypothetical protein
MPMDRSLGDRISRRSWWLAGFVGVLALAGALTYLAYREALPAALDAVPGSDKLLHLFIAGALAFFLDGSLGRRDVRALGRPLPLAAIVVLVPVGIEEILQSLSPVRTSSIWDYSADCAGVAASVWAGRRFVGPAHVASA